MGNESNERLAVLWTSGDREVADKMVFMYTYNAKMKEWWREVTLIVWGPSQKLICADEDLQLYLEKLKQAGVELLACKTCSDSYGISDDLEKLGIVVKFMGQPFTQILKGDYKLITF
jgi:hypothetical protein